MFNQINGLSFTLVIESIFLFKYLLKVIRVRINLELVDVYVLEYVKPLFIAKADSVRI